VQARLLSLHMYVSMCAEVIAQDEWIDVVGLCIDRWIGNGSRSRAVVVVVTTKQNAVLKQNGRKKRNQTDRLTETLRVDC